MSAETPTKSESGFTLMEVLAALLIFSISMIGLLQSTAHGARTTAQIELKTLAGIVADNKLTVAAQDLTKLRPSGNSLSSSGTSTQMGRNFEWRVEMRNTPAEGLFEFIAEVRHDDQLILTRRTYGAGRRIEPLPR